MPSLILIHPTVWPQYTKITDRTHRTSRLVFTARLRPQVRMPAECPAQFRVLKMAKTRISERTPFSIYENAQCRVFERTSLQRAYVIPCRQQMGSSARSALVLAASTRCLRRVHSIGRGCSVHTCAMTIGADFKIYLLRQFCSNRVDFFTIHRRHRRKK